MTATATAASASALTAVDWAFASADTTYSTHGIHPYPAKFIPQIPRVLLESLTSPGDTVLDPFLGSGTTALEAVLLGRRFVGIDANPFAVLLSRVKIGRLDSTASMEIDQLLDALGEGAVPDASPSAFRPVIPNQHKWYADHVYEELVRLRELVTDVSTATAGDVAMLAFLRVASALSFQESETRYVSSPRAIASGAATSMLASRLANLRSAIVTADIRSQEPSLIEVRDARDPMPGEPDSIDLVVTSPPYPNAYDYHLYQRFRLLWLGASPVEFKHVEIGCHLKGQSQASPFDSYESDMSKVLGHVARSLKPGAHAVFVVGDGLSKGETYFTSRRLASIAAVSGLSHARTIDRPLPRNRRAVTSAGRRLQTEQLVVLQKGR